MAFRVDIFSVALPSAATLAGIQYFGKGYYLYLLGILVKGTTFTIYTFYALTCRDIYRDIEPDLKQILFIAFFCFYVYIIVFSSRSCSRNNINDNSYYITLARW